MTHYGRGCSGQLRMAKVIASMAEDLRRSCAALFLCGAGQILPTPQTASRAPYFGVHQSASNE